VFFSPKICFPAAVDCGVSHNPDKLSLSVNRQICRAHFLCVKKFQSPNLEKSQKDQSMKTKTLFGIIGALVIASQVTIADHSFASTADCGPLVGGVHEVSTAAQLQNVGAEGAGTGACQLGANYKQMNTITLPDPSVSLTSGQSNGPATSGNFTGTYDGQNFSVIGFASNRQSFFRGDIKADSTRAVVKNLRLVDVDATNMTQRGVLATSIDNADIDNVQVQGSVGVSGSDVGGFGRYLLGDARIINSASDLTITSENQYQRDNIGGLVYEMSGTSRIISSWTTGSFTGVGDGVGGLVGTTGENTLISQSWSSATISGVETVDGIGGLVGFHRGEIRFSFATGDVTASGSRIGGLVGRMENNSATVRDSYALGQVTITGGTGTSGGLIGNLQRTSQTVTRSLSTTAPAANSAATP